MPSPRRTSPFSSPGPGQKPTPHPARPGIPLRARPHSNQSRKSIKKPLKPLCQNISFQPINPAPHSAIPHSADRNRPSKTQPDSIRLNQTTRFFSRSAPNPHSAFPDPKDGDTSEQWKERRGDPSREMVLWLARRHTAMTLGQLGERAGPTDYAAIAMALKRFELKMQNDPNLRKTMQNLEGVMCNVKMCPMFVVS